MIPFAERQVEEVFESYPEVIRGNLLALRDLVFVTAQRIGVANDLTEALKWGEPGYLCKQGSTVRLNWKEDDPDHYRICFHCQTSLIPTFRNLYASDFEFEGNRAIRLSASQEPDLTKLGHCIEMSLKYHRLKELSLLGAKGE